MDAMLEYDLRTLLKKARVKTIRDLEPADSQTERTLTASDWQRLRALVNNFPDELVRGYIQQGQLAKAELKNLARVEFNVSSGLSLTKTASILEAAVALKRRGKTDRWINEFVRWSARNASVVFYVEYASDMPDVEEPDETEYVPPLFEADDSAGAGGVAKTEWWSETREAMLLSIFEKAEKPKVKNTFRAWRHWLSQPEDITPGSPQQPTNGPPDSSDEALRARLWRIRGAAKRKAYEAALAAKKAEEEAAAARARYEALVDGFEEEKLD